MRLKPELPSVDAARVRVWILRVDEPRPSARNGADLVLGIALLVMLILVSVGDLNAQPLFVEEFQRINDTDGDFDGEFVDGDAFGQAIARLGDFSGDGTGALAVIDRSDGTRLWILFLNSDGTVDEYAEIVPGEGEAPDAFMIAVAELGDLDGDGVVDIAVGDPTDDDGGTGSSANLGAVWVLFLNDDGTVADSQKISATAGLFGGDLDVGDNFGYSLSAFDLDGDGVSELAVTAFRDDDGGEDLGAIWILTLDFDGTVLADQKISSSEGGFAGTLEAGDEFGRCIGSLDDVDGNGTSDLVVGAPRDDDGGTDRGAIWILLMEDDGAVAETVKISDTEGDFTGALEDNARFGCSLTSMIDDDSLAVVTGAIGQQALFVLLLDTDGSVDSWHEIGSDDGPLAEAVEDGEGFGISLATVGDLDGDGVSDLAVGAISNDGGGTNRGAVYIIFLGFPFVRGDLNGDGEVSALVDALYLLQWGFVNGDDPTCWNAADADDSGDVSPLLDALFLLQYGFNGGDLPPDPGPEECGGDPTLDEDDLRCPEEVCL